MVTIEKPKKIVFTEPDLSQSFHKKWIPSTPQLAKTKYPLINSNNNNNNEQFPTDLSYNNVNTPNRLQETKLKYQYNPSHIMTFLESDIQQRVLTIDYFGMNKTYRNKLSKVNKHQEISKNDDPKLVTHIVSKNNNKFIKDKATKKSGLMFVSDLWDRKYYHTVLKQTNIYNQLKSMETSQRSSLINKIDKLHSQFILKHKEYFNNQYVIRSKLQEKSSNSQKVINENQINHNETKKSDESIKKDADNLTNCKSEESLFGITDLAVYLKTPSPKRNILHHRISASTDKLNGFHKDKYWMELRGRKVPQTSQTSKFILGKTSPLENMNANTSTNIDSTESLTSNVTLKSISKKVPELMQLPNIISLNDELSPTNKYLSTSIRSSYNNKKYHKSKLNKEATPLQISFEPFNKSLSNSNNLIYKKSLQNLIDKCKKLENDNDLYKDLANLQKFIDKKRSK